MRERVRERERDTYIYIYEDTVILFGLEDSLKITVWDEFCLLIRRVLFQSQSYIFPHLHFLRTLGHLSERLRVLGIFTAVLQCPSDGLLKKLSCPSPLLSFKTFQGSISL